MPSIQHIQPHHAKAFEGLFFDLDGTLLDDGKLTQDAYSALFALQASGLRLVVLTGRPAAWGQVLARLWPVEAAIAENGAIAFRAGSSKMEVLDTAPTPEERTRRTVALRRLVTETRKALPSLTPADDVNGRITDFTFDIGEHRMESQETIAEAETFARRARARTTRSSVHLHFSFDRVDKATGALSYIARTGGDPTRARNTFAFIGDSDNDAPAFAAFSHAVGVKNLQGDFSIPPRFLTDGAASQGFCEFAHHLCQLRLS